jgi:hypothetical protein
MPSRERAPQTSLNAGPSTQPGSITVARGLLPAESFAALVDRRLAPRSGIDARIRNTSDLLADLGVGQCYFASELRDIAVWFVNGQIGHHWGAWLTRLNTPSYKRYLLSVISQEVPVADCSFAFGATSRHLGNLRLRPLAIRPSWHYGGSLEMILTLDEPFGIEFYDSAKGIGIDARDMLVRLYLCVTPDMINAPNVSIMPTRVHVRLDLRVWEACVVQGGRIEYGPEVDAADLAALLSAAEVELRSGLEKMAAFMLGFIHEQKLSDFSPTSERIRAVQISDGILRFERQQLRPFVDVWMSVGVASIWGDVVEPAVGDPVGKAELTMQGLLSLGKNNNAALHQTRLDQYTGNAIESACVLLMSLTREQAAEIEWASVLARYVEDDYPFPDDTESATVNFNVGLDLQKFDNAVAQKIAVDLFDETRDRICVDEEGFLSAKYNAMVVRLRLTVGYH